jgi:hypothetical protein
VLVGVGSGVELKGVGSGVGSFAQAVVGTNITNVKKSRESIDSA